MRLTGHTKFIVTLLLLAFFCQTIAALAMSCQLKTQTHSSTNHSTVSSVDHSNMNHAMMDHSKMNHELAAIPDHQTDCCKTPGQCLLNGCLLGGCFLGNCSLISVSNSFDFSFSTSSSNATPFYSIAQRAPLIYSLYRPPIFS